MRGRIFNLSARLKRWMEIKKEVSDISSSAAPKAKIWSKNFISGKVQKSICY